jgi:hypothetical protein
MIDGLEGMAIRDGRGEEKLEFFSITAYLRAVQ